MTRRSSGNLSESVAGVSWPMGPGFGLIGFAVFYWLAPWVVSSNSIPSLTPIIARLPLDGLAWLCLAIGGIGLFLSRFRTRHRTGQIKRQTGRPLLQSLSWPQFEILVAQAYRRLGYAVEKAGEGGANAGVDLVLRRNGEATLVLCRQWRELHIGVYAIRELGNLVQHHGAAAGKFICTGAFSSDCVRFVVGKPIELVDGPALSTLVAGINVLELAPQWEDKSSPPPQCPECSLAMVKRADPATGESLWGCADYPRCRGTRPFA